MPLFEAPSWFPESGTELGTTACRKWVVEEAWEGGLGPTSSSGPELRKVICKDLLLEPPLLSVAWTPSSGPLEWTWPPKHADLAGTSAAADLAISGPHCAGVGAEADLAGTAAAAAAAWSRSTFLVAGSRTDTGAGSWSVTGFNAAGCGGDGGGSDPRHLHSGTVNSAGSCAFGPGPAAPTRLQVVRGNSRCGSLIRSSPRCDPPVPAEPHQ